MRYIQNEQFDLRGWEKLPYAVTDHIFGNAHFFTAEQMDALKLCNGKIEMDIPSIPKAIRAEIPKFIKYSIIQPAKVGEALRPSQEYHKYHSR